MNSEIGTWLSTNYNSFPQDKILKILSGELSSDDISNYDDYSDLYRIRHDILHYFVAMDRDLPFKERHISDIKELHVCKKHKFWPLIEKQSPDIIMINNNLVKIIEFTVSGHRYAEAEKTSKYNLLLTVLEESGFVVDLEVIVYSLSISIPDSEEFCRTHNITELTYIRMSTLIRAVTNLIREIESTEIGQGWAFKRLKNVDIKFPDIVSTKELNDYISKMENPPLDLQISFEQDDVKDYHLLSEEDDAYIDKCITSYNLIEDSDKSYYKEEKLITDVMIELRSYYNEQKNSGYFRPFLPLPYMQFKGTDSITRLTKDDEYDLNLELKILLHQTKDSFLDKIGDMKQTMEFVKLSREEEYKIALEGPGRKRFIGKSIEHKKAQDKNSNYLSPFNVYDSEVEDLLDEFSKVESRGNNPEDISGPGLSYVEACQSVYREININVMRSDRRKQMILKPTGVSGIYLLIWPGPKLRTGENVSIIWFKLFAIRSKINYTIRFNRSFHQWRQTECDDLLESGWLSTDANRLDHYIRCYDRIRMAYLAYMNQRTPMTEYVPGDELGVIISIYMEDKRSTSKMIQDCRYVVMMSLSIFRQWTDLKKKFQLPLRTPLQALLLSRIINYCDGMLNVGSILSKSRFGKLINEGTNEPISDRFAGAIIELPRILTKGNNINFQQLLCEMYFCMLFNKNQDDPTHASFQILDKILEGEREFLNRLNDSNKNVFGGIDETLNYREIFMNKFTHQFSKRAIIIGSKLQSSSDQNISQGGLAYKKASYSQSLNKSLDEFATYKSSSTFQRKVVNKDIYKIDKDEMVEEPVIEEEFISDIISERIPMKDSLSQNPRRRCIEGIMDLIHNHNCKDSFDVARLFKSSDLHYQVFKKNQIGGVREILILPIEKRITINILETISRVICKEDHREMLTHGATKYSHMKDILRELRRSTYKGIIVHHNLDKSRWGPTFIPIQFLYIFEPFKYLAPEMYRYITMTLLVHSQKECVLPEKLIRVWLNDSNDKIHHSNEDLQKLKETFLIDKKLSFKNQSNMGQGILHYTSSLLHLCAISFRDVVYKKLCNRARIYNHGDWRDLVSSDDSYTAQLVPLDKHTKMRIHLMRKATRITDLLFNMRTSNTKSSNSVVIGEFNSLFCSNLDTFPTTFKFALSSVECINTDSFFRMVKEAYQNCRQLIENGGSTQLYLCAQRMNKKFCESLYHTSIGLENDLSKFGVQIQNIPYQLGIYPVDNECPELMLMFGPEYYNYDILSRFNDDKLNDKEKQLFLACHTFVDKLDPETIAETLSYESFHVGLHRIEAHMGPIRSLQRIRRKVRMSWEEMKNKIYDDPLLLLRDPKTIDEVKLRTYIKLFQYGSAEALRTTASSIYYARVSASVSANAFHIPSTEMSLQNSENKLGYLYKDCLNYLMKMNVSGKIPSELYPFITEFKLIKKLTESILPYYPRNPLETKNLRSLELCSFHTQFKNSLVDLLEAFWINRVDDIPTSYRRDWVNLKLIFPMIKDSIEQTLSDINSDNKGKALQEFIVKMMRIMNIGSKPMKAIIYGQTTRSVENTYHVLRGQNKTIDSTTNEVADTMYSEETITTIYRLYQLYNVWAILREMKKDVNIIKSLYSEEDLQKLVSNKYLSEGVKKRILMMSLDLNKVEDVITWTRNTGVILHRWDERQRYERGRYQGDFNLSVQLGSVIMQCYSKSSKIHIVTNNTSSGSIIYELFVEISKLLQQEPESFSKMLLPGTYNIYGQKIYSVIGSSGFNIETSNNLSNVSYEVGDVTFEENTITMFDMNGYQIMRTSKGFLSSDYSFTTQEMKYIPDVRVSNLSLHKLIKYQLFSADFRFDQLHEDSVLDMVDDFKVERPEISNKTKIRLGQFFDIRNFEIKDSSSLTEDSIVESSERDIKEHNDRLMEMFLNVDIELNDMGGFFDEKLHQTEITNDEKDILRDLLDVDIQELHLLTNLKPIEKRFLSLVLYDRIRFAKYHLISKLFMNPTQISARSIRYVHDSVTEVGVTYSLIFVYNKVYGSTDHESPPIFKPVVSESLNKKFPSLRRNIGSVLLE